MTWITQFMLFHNKRHPHAMASADISAFLAHVAVQQNVAASTHNQALSVLLFLSRDVLKRPLALSLHAVRANQPKRLPTILTKDDTLNVIESVSPQPYDS